MIWLMEMLKIYLEEQLLINIYVIKYLILPKIQNMMNIKGVLLQWFIKVLIKVCQEGLLEVKLCQASK